MQPDKIDYQKRIFWLLVIVLVIVPVIGGMSYTIWHFHEVAKQEEIKQKQQSKDAQDAFQKAIKKVDDLLKR